VEARRQVLGLPLDVKALRFFSTALDEFEQAVAWAHVPPTVGLKDDGRPRPPDARVDHAEKDGPRRKPSGVGCQQIGRCLGIAGRGIGEQVDNWYGRRHLMQHCLHLTGIGAVQPEIRDEHNHIGNSPADVDAMPTPLGAKAFARATRRDPLYTY
jgi:hypothetical protein